MLLQDPCHQADHDHRAVVRTTHDVLVDCAARTPDAIALVDADGPAGQSRTWTYAELRDDSARLAVALLSRFEPGERIAVWAPDRPERVLLQFAAGLAGLVLVTVNPAYQARELGFILDHAEAVGLFLVESHRGNPLSRIAAEVAAGHPRLREVIDLMDTTRLYAKQRIVDGLPEVRPEDPAQILYACGAAGRLRGAILHHRDLIKGARRALGATRTAAAA